MKPPPLEPEDPFEEDKKPINKPLKKYHKNGIDIRTITVVINS